MSYPNRYEYAICDNTGSFLQFNRYTQNNLPTTKQKVRINHHDQPIASVDHISRKVILATGPEEYRVLVDGKDIGGYTFDLINIAKRGALIIIGGVNYKGGVANHKKRTLTANVERIRNRR